MPWGRVDDQHYRHEKLGELDEDLRKGCIALYWLAISWCNDRLTDGRVPAGIVRVLGGNVDEAEELARVGLWDKDGKAYRVHDYLDFNKSRAQVREERVQRTLAGKAGAAARWHPASDVPSDVPDEMLGGSNAPVPRTPSPVTPSPAPDARIAEGNDPWDDPEHEAVVWLAKHGCDLRAGNGFLNHVITLVEAFGVNAVVGMFDRLAREGVRNGDTKGFVFKAKDALYARSRPNIAAIEKEEAADERADVRSKRIARQMWERRLELHRETGQWDDAWGPVPVSNDRGAA